MRDFNQRGGSRGGFKSGGNRSFGGRPSFGGDRDRRDHDRGPVTMHKATCATCGEACEVPFRPSGDKPVYCSQCFEKGGSPSGKTPDQTKQQFEILNSKLDKILKALNPEVFDQVPKEEVRKSETKKNKAKKTSAKPAAKRAKAKK